MLYQLSYTPRPPREVARESNRRKVEAVLRFATAVGSAGNGV